MSDKQLLKKNRKGIEYIEVNGEIISKRCTICMEMKVLEHYPKQKQGLGGTVSRCKLCINDRHKIFREQNAEFWKERTRKYYEENRERYRETRRNYYQENKEYFSEQNKKFRDENPDYDKKFYEKNRERIREKKRESDKRYYEKKE